MGVELSLEDVLEQTGFRKPEAGEEVIQKAQPVASPFGADSFQQPSPLTP
jgi:hypothetical protein